MRDVLHAPVRVGPLIVAEAGTEIGAHDGIIMWIEPSMATGTASSGAATLCLDRIIQRFERQRPEVVLEVATGTGLLVIAALLLGSRRGVATEIDPHARTLAKRNAALNGVGSRLLVSQCAPDELGERFELVLANLPSSRLLALLPSILPSISATGEAVLSGLLEEESERLIAACAHLGFEVIEQSARDGWVCFVVRR